MVTYHSGVKEVEGDTVSDVLSEGDVVYLSTLEHPRPVKRVEETVAFCESETGMDIMLELEEREDSMVLAATRGDTPIQYVAEIVYPDMDKVYTFDEEIESSSEGA